MGSGGQEGLRHAVNLPPLRINLAICHREHTQMGPPTKNQTLLEHSRVSNRHRHPGRTCSEHAPDVGVALVEPLLHDGVDKGRAVEESPLV